mmetsp:Transcript_167332/g.296284  ORF Transcript_167332/g.296284 Transcript_167332/m.296284 type:complete len:286 (-) Transcript_167332:69-926(-)
MVVATLASPRHLELNARRVPRANAGNFPEATVGFASQASAAPTSDDTVEALTLAGANDINHFILRKDISNFDLLLEETHCKINFLLHRASVDLNLLDVGLLLSNLHFRDLGVADHANDLAVLLRPGNFGGHGRALTTLGRILPTLLILREGLLLGLVPVLVEATLDLVTEVACPHRCQCPQATRCLHIAGKAYHNHRWCFQDADTFHHLLLVQLGTGLIHIPHNVCHASLVGHEGSEVRWLRSVILGEALDLAVVMLCALPGQEPQATMARPFKLAVRHCIVLSY